MPYSIRPAVDADIETIVGFTLDEAREAEGLHLDDEAVRVGGHGDVIREGGRWFRSPSSGSRRLEPARGERGGRMDVPRPARQGRRG